MESVLGSVRCSLFFLSPSSSSFLHLSPLLTLSFAPQPPHHLSLTRMYSKLTPNNTGARTAKPLTCVWCRAAWASPTRSSNAGTSRASFSVEGYMNLGAAAGLDSDRDTSTCKYRLGVLTFERMLILILLSFPLVYRLPRTEEGPAVLWLSRLSLMRRPDCTGRAQ